MNAQYNYMGVQMTRVFRTNVKKPRKGSIPQETVDKILAMRPEDLAVELAREQLAVDTLKEELAEDQQVIDAKALLEKLDEAIESETDIVEAKGKLEDALAAHRDNDEYQTAKLDAKLAGAEFKKDISFRNKVIKLMKKTVRSHIASGALKLKS